eukprot:TRINITY_DN27675_c0_g1_i1.p1 TRINITY_DN27675_c0_g1~~TRINITY_DN27675_c0_g1_i1.p1  ORF type:complete len:892 (+),score=306.47 TRINITY_DN27675_c0_g1_i1:136-2811(+)
MGCCQAKGTPEESKENEEPLMAGVTYEQFAKLLEQHYASPDVQSQNTTYRPAGEAWKFTAKELDKDDKGFLHWEDIEKPVKDISLDLERATAISNIIEIITRSRVQLRHLFRTLDVDGGGSVSKKEFTEGLLMLNRDIDVDTVDGLWAMLDRDSDESVSLSEFMAGLSVNDTLGKHPDVETFMSQQVKGAQRRSRSRANLTKVLEESKLKVDPERFQGEAIEAAAKKIQKLYRQQKSLRMLRSRIWQAVARALDDVDEMEVNMSTAAQIAGKTSNEDARSVASDDSVDTQTGEGYNGGLDSPKGGSTLSPLQASIDLPEIVDRPQYSLPDVISELMVNTALPSEEVAQCIVTDATRLLQVLPNVGQVSIPENGKVHVVGDLHGQVEDLQLILGDCGMPDSDRCYLFNGDFVDRGPSGVECLLLLYSLKLQYPDYVFLNRGNHETRRLNEKYGFDEEVKTKYSFEMFQMITTSFTALPLAHVVGDHFFVIHGGLGPDPKTTINDYNQIDRFRQIPRRDDSTTGTPEQRRLIRIFESAVWSDPRDVDDWVESKRGAGIFFGELLVSQFLKTNGLSKLIRSHESYQPGYHEHHDRKTVTVFSASNYCGIDDNRGCYLTVTPNKEVQYSQYKCATHLKNLLKEHSSSIADYDNVATAEENALRRLRMLIFTRKTKLMHAFQQSDSDKTGKVKLEHWVEAMSAVINDGVPWLNIHSKLVIRETDGLIAYIPFLERYQNPMQSKWMNEWANKMISLLGSRMQSWLARNQSEGVTEFSYYGICESLRGFLPGLSELGAYYIILNLDTNGDGFIAFDEFVRAFSSRPQQSKKFCLVELWEMFTFDMPSYMYFRRVFLKYSNRNMSTGSFQGLNPLQQRPKDGKNNPRSPRGKKKNAQHC